MSSPNTLKNHLYAERRLTNLGITPDLIATAPDVVLSRIDSIPNLGTRGQTMAAVIRLSNGLPNAHVYQSYWKQLCELISFHRGSNQCKYNQAQRANIWKTIDKLYKENEKCANDLQTNRFILTSFYKYQPPRRCELANIKLVSKMEDCDASGNFIVMDDTNPVMVLNQYKTAKTYATQVHPLHPQFYFDIKKTLAVPRDTLFKGLSKDPNAFSHYVKSTLGVGVSDMRHLYITDKLKDVTYNDRKSVAHAMGHSIGTQLQYLYIE